MMKLESEHYSNPVGWAIVLYGAVLSFVSAFTPHFAIGYQMQFELMLAGFTPYLLYAIAVPLMRGKVTTAVGLVLAAVHTVQVVAVRGFAADEGLMLSVPALLSVLAIPLVIVALAKTRHIKPPENRLIRH